jgi:hypothetical protein
MVVRVSDGKGSASTSLKLKATAKCGDPKMLADAMKSYPGTVGAHFFAGIRKYGNTDPNSVFNHANLGVIRFI